MLKLAQQTATTNAGAKLDVVAYDFVRGCWGLIWEGYDPKTQGMLLRIENCLAALANEITPNHLQLNARLLRYRVGWRPTKWE